MHHTTNISLKKFFLALTLLSLVLSFIGCSNNISLEHNYPENNTPNDNTNVISNESNTINDVTEPEEDEVEEIEPEPITSEIIISFIGDSTLGTDPNFGGQTFVWEFENQGGDYSYFYRNVKPYFDESDLTIANLEGTFTESNNKADKKFTFKAPPHYVNILTEGGIDAVTIANNHIYDYGYDGYQDTLNALEGTGVDYFGYDHIWTTEVNGEKLAFLGYEGWNGSINYDTIANTIGELKDDGYTVIINFHWGVERDYYPQGHQEDLARHCIDSGASIIIGHHPHVLQGVENYNDGIIAYSLGNFCFGGNSNPSDKRSMIFQTSLKFVDHELTELGVRAIPTRISSTESRNDYQPTPYEYEEGLEVLTFLNELSPNLDFFITDEFYYITIGE